MCNASSPGTLGFPQHPQEQAVAAGRAWVRDNATLASEPDAPAGLTGTVVEQNHGVRRFLGRNRYHRLHRPVRQHEGHDPRSRRRWWSRCQVESRRQSAAGDLRNRAVQIGRPGRSARPHTGPTPESRLDHAAAATARLSLGGWISAGRRGRGRPLPLPRQHARALGGIRRLTQRHGLAESRMRGTSTSGSEGGPGKLTSRKAGQRAPGSTPTLSG